MKKKRFNEIQIINILKEYEAGVPAVDSISLILCIEIPWAGISDLLTY